VGIVLTATRTITSEDIDTCGRLTGDFGSHHVNGMAGRQIAQGLLTLAFAPLFMRDGVHMSEASTRFLAPVFAGDTITANVEIAGMANRPDGLVDLSCVVKVVNSEGVVVLNGTACARAPAGVIDTEDGYIPIGAGNPARHDEGATQYVDADARDSDRILEDAAWRLYE